MDIRKAYGRWLERATEDPELTAELAALDLDGPEASDRFYRDLAFGTGGLRGVLGAGTNTMTTRWTLHPATSTSSW